MSSKSKGTAQNMEKVNKNNYYIKQQMMAQGGKQKQRGVSHDAA